MSEPDNAAYIDPTTLPLCTDVPSLFENLCLFGFSSWPDATGGREWPYAGVCAYSYDGDTHLLMAELALFLGLDVVNDHDSPVRPEGDLALRVAKDGRAWLEHDGREVVHMRGESWGEWHRFAVETGHVILMVGCRPLSADEDPSDYFHSTCDLDNTALASIPVKQVWLPRVAMERRQSAMLVVGIVGLNAGCTAGSGDVDESASNENTQPKVRCGSVGA